MKEQLNRILKAKKRARKFVIGDIIFALLPAFILLLTRLATMNFDNFVTRSDWSYVALILFGQSLIRFIFGLSENKNPKSSSSIVLLTIIIFAFGILPTAIFLVLIEISPETNLILVVLQYLMLVLSIVTYSILSSVGQILGENPNIDMKDVFEAERIEKESRKRRRQLTEVE